MMGKLKTLIGDLKIMGNLRSSYQEQLLPNSNSNTNSQRSKTSFMPPDMLPPSIQDFMFDF